MVWEEQKGPLLILVSGAPGSGKTTLAGALGEIIIRFPLISKDVIKEALYDSLTVKLTSTELSEAAMNVLWAVARWCPRAILEANFHPISSRERVLTLAGRKLEIHCVCPLEVCADRYRRRTNSIEHHPVHPRELTMESFEKYGAAIAACPVVEVETEKPVELGEVLKRIREHWPDL